MPELPPGAVPEAIELEVEDLAASLHAAQARLDRFLSDAGVAARPAYRANLAFEELATNSLKYGGSGIEPLRVRCTVRIEAEGLTLEFRDRGAAFDPTSAAPPETPSTLAEAKIGGLGLELVRKMSTGVDYLRQDGENRTTVRIGLDRG